VVVGSLQRVAEPDLECVSALDSFGFYGLEAVSELDFEEWGGGG